MAKTEVLGQVINPSLHEVYTKHANVFIIVASDGSLILVDTGAPKSETTIIKYINSIGKSVKDIKYIFLTHSHIDHFGSAYALKQLSEAKIAIHNNGINSIDGTDGLRMPIPHNTKEKVMLSMFKLMMKAMPKAAFVKPDMVLKEGAFPKEFGVDAKILETPGHTSDSISIYLNDSKTLICGDMFDGRRGGLTLPKFFEDYISWLNSVKKIKDLNPDLICVAHGKNYAATDIKT